MKIHLGWSALVLAFIACVSLNASDVPKEFKEKLEARYKGQKAVVLPPKILVGLVDTGSFISPFKVNYDHFHSSVEMPKVYGKRNNFDDRTTEEVTAEAGRVDFLQPGEIVSIHNMQIFKRSKEFYAVDIYLVALAQKRLTLGTTYGGGLEKKSYGVHFRFAFAPKVIEEGDYDTVVAEINKYVLPQEEYQKTLATAEKVKEAKKTVEIQPGMTKEEVIQGLGEPTKTIVFGKKTFLKYPEITVELEDNKVTEVKPN